MKLNGIIGLLLSIFTLSACKHEEIFLQKPNEDVRSLGGFIGNNFDYTLFYAGLQYTGLLDTLNSPGPFTVLAPNNAAFNQLGIFRAADFAGKDRDSLYEVLAYHILPLRLMEADIPNHEIDLRYETLAGPRLYASKSIGNWGYPLLYFSGAEVANTDVELSNGVMHALTKLIKPYHDLTIQDWLGARPEYSTFVAGLQKFGLWDELATAGPFTVFAPRNEIFAAQGIDQSALAAMDASLYIGARLFGAYIIYEKQFFIRDYDFFLNSQQQYWEISALRNDPGYNRIFMGKTQFNEWYENGMRAVNFINRVDPGLAEFPVPWDYSLGITKRSTPYLYDTNYATDIADFLGGGNQILQNHYCAGFYPERNDHLCQNGVIHDLQSVLVLPSESLKAE